MGLGMTYPAVSSILATMASHSGRGKDSGGIEIWTFTGDSGQVDVAFDGDARARKATWRPATPRPSVLARLRAWLGW